MSEPVTQEDVDEFDSTTSAFLTSLGINTALLAVLMTTYLFLRPRFATLYSPRLLLMRTRIPPLPKSLLGWIPALMKIDDKMIFEEVGLDALILLRFFRLNMKLAAFFFAYGALILVPIYATGKNDASELDVVSFANVEQASWRIWAAWLGVYLFTFAVLKLLWTEFDAYARFRGQLGYENIELMSIMVTEIPSDTRKYPKKLQLFFEKMFPNSLLTVEWVRDFEAYDQALSKHNRNAILRQRYLSVLQERGVRRMVRVGTPCYNRRKVDGVEYYEDQTIFQYQTLEETYKEDCAKPPLPVAFVTFKSLVTATTVAQSQLSTDIQHYYVDKAPHPDDVDWENLKYSFAERLERKMIVAAIVFALIAFYMIPINIINALINLDSLTERLPFLEDVLSYSSFVRGFLEGFLPTLALKIFLAVLPIILAFLAKKEGIPSFSGQALKAMNYYFYFLVINVFLGIVLGGSFIGSIEEFIDNPTGVIEQMSETLSKIGTFWINFIMLATLVSFSLELLRVVAFFKRWIFLRFISNYDYEKRQAWMPGDPSYEKNIPMHLLIFMIGITYSVLAPVISPFLLLYFFLAHMTWKKQLLYVYIEKWNTGGKIFILIFNRMIIATLLFQVVMISVLSLKESPVASSTLVPVVPITIYFWYFGLSYFKRRSDYVTIEQATEIDRKRLLIDNERKRRKRLKKLAEEDEIGNGGKGKIAKNIKLAGLDSEPEPDAEDSTLRGVNPYIKSRAEEEEDIIEDDKEDFEDIMDDDSKATAPPLFGFTEKISKVGGTLKEKVVGLVKGGDSTKKEDDEVSSDENQGTEVEHERSRSRKTLRSRRHGKRSRQAPDASQELQDVDGTDQAGPSLEELEAGTRRQNEDDTLPLIKYNNNAVTYGTDDQESTSDTDMTQTSNGHDSSSKKGAEAGKEGNGKGRVHETPSAAMLKTNRLAYISEENLKDIGEEYLTPIPRHPYRRHKRMPGVVEVSQTDDLLNPYGIVGTDDDLLEDIHEYLKYRESLGPDAGDLQKKPEDESSDEEEEAEIGEDSAEAKRPSDNSASCHEEGGNYKFKKDDHDDNGEGPSDFSKRKLDDPRTRGSEGRSASAKEGGSSNRGNEQTGKNEGSSRSHGRRRSSSAAQSYEALPGEEELSRKRSASSSQVTQRQSQDQEDPSSKREDLCENGQLPVQVPAAELGRDRRESGTGSRSEAEELEMNIFDIPSSGIGKGPSAEAQQTHKNSGSTKTKEEPTSDKDRRFEGGRNKGHAQGQRALSKTRERPSPINTQTRSSSNQEESGQEAHESTKATKQSYSPVSYHNAGDFMDYTESRVETDDVLSPMAAGGRGEEVPDVDYEELTE